MLGIVITFNLECFYWLLQSPHHDITNIGFVAHRICSRTPLAVDCEDPEAESGDRERTFGMLQREEGQYHRRHKHVVAMSLQWGNIEYKWFPPSLSVLEYTSLNRRN